MLGKYRIIALDMDGTVLNDKKQMDKRTMAAIQKALTSGKEVVFCTGRSLAEMKDTLEEFPKMRYLCCASGALLYDLERGLPMKIRSIPWEEVEKIREVIRGRDIMLHVMNEGRCIIPRQQSDRMEHYQMGVYQESFLRVSILEDHVLERAEAERWRMEKINLFHTSPAEREISRRELERRGCSLSMVDSEISSLECSERGVNKAEGLRALCSELKIGMDELIMVGDANNDLPALEAAGLAVAMGNANDHVKAVCDVQVADNNHDGCAEAIERYLLQEA